ncbi:hypothetical protein L596_028520 [Steinernema carpocapsae]|uniref:Protein kinase domain-containing protein n=1 Tax=Steinernema carpocapsae TaxID=34508 RepID=A0A4U5LYP3_STECR|nr:hypothetical protein L596_028520 [Steinernema carpocapsae]
MQKRPLSKESRRLSNEARQLSNETRHSLPHKSPRKTPASATRKNHQQRGKSPVNRGQAGGFVYNKSSHRSPSAKKKNSHEVSTNKILIHSRPKHVILKPGSAIKFIKKIALEKDKPPKQLVFTYIVVGPYKPWNSMIGAVYSVQTKKMRRALMMKTEYIDADTRKGLEIEAAVYQSAEYGKTVTEHLLKFIDFQETKTYRVLITEPIGITLEELVANGKLHTTVAVRFAFETFKALEELHSLGFVHRDVKPANFAIGTGDHQNRVMINDLQTSLKSGSEVKSKFWFIGSQRYASRFAYEGNTHTFMCDIESWLLMCIDFFDPAVLPWHRFARQKAKTLELKRAFFKDIRQYPNILGILPDQFDAIYANVKVTNYKSKPPYSYISDLLSISLDQLEIDTEEPFNDQFSFHRDNTVVDEGEEAPMDTREAAEIEVGNQDTVEEGVSNQVPVKMPSDRHHKSAPRPKTHSAPKKSRVSGLKKIKTSGVNRKASGFLPRPPPKGDPSPRRKNKEKKRKDVKAAEAPDYVISSTVDKLTKKSPAKNRENEDGYAIIQPDPEAIESLKKTMEEEKVPKSKTIEEVKVPKAKTLKAKTLTSLKNVSKKATAMERKTTTKVKTEENDVSVEEPFKQEQKPKHKTSKKVKPEENDVALESPKQESDPKAKTSQC